MTVAGRIAIVFTVLLATGCSNDPAAPEVSLAVRQYCATTDGLVHEFAWPWNDSTAEWVEVALADSAPIGAGYCLTFNYHTETSGTFSGGGSFGAWFDTWELGLVDTMPLWYLRNDTAQGAFLIRNGAMSLTFDRGGRWLERRGFLLHSPPTADGFTTSGTTPQPGQGYLHLVLRWRPVTMPSAPQPAPAPPASPSFAAERLKR